MSESHIQEQIDVIAKHEREFLAQRTTAERCADAVAAFAGRISFVVLHLAFFTGWIAWNLIAGLRHFDPAPFSLLSTIVAMEAIVLASFILMRQTRTARREDEREHLMLQILLLTEQELTAVLRVNRQIAQRLGLERVATNEDVNAFSQPTSVDDIAQQIREGLASNE